MSDAFFARRPLVPDKRAWSARLKLTAPSFKVQHKILHLRRVVSQVKNIGRAEAAKFWVDIARAARRDGQHKIWFVGLFLILLTAHRHLILSHTIVLWAAHYDLFAYIVFI